MKVCIVGATGLVGRMFLKVLDEQNIDYKDINLYASNKSIGQSIKYKDEYLFVKSKIEEFEPDKTCFILCVDKEISKELTPFLLDKGAYVIDCSTQYRNNIAIPLIAVGVNENKIGKSKLICNPNCVVLQVVIPLFILEKEYGIERVDLVSLQSVSGSGKKGLDDLDNDETSFYPYKIKDTCIPLIGNILDNNYSEEEMKIENEIKRILKKDFEISATCIRVPIKYCHGISMSILLKKETSEKMIIELLSSNPNLKYCQIPNGIEAVKNDFVYFGRVRKDLYNKRLIHMYVVGNNLRRGAAANALWILNEIQKSI